MGSSLDTLRDEDDRPTPAINPLRVLGIDGGLATFGWCMWEPVGDLGTWRSTNEEKKRKTSRSADLRRRARELADFVGQLLAEHKPDIIALEAISQPRHARTAMAIGIAAGAVEAAISATSIPIVEVSPQMTRKLLRASGSATKGEVWASADPTGAWRETASGLLATERPHALDAMAVAVAATHTQEWALVRAALTRRPR